MPRIESAYGHMAQELGFDKVEASLREEFDLLEKAHDAIHEYLLLAPLFFPFRNIQESDWHRKSAFLIYHWEVFQHAHRSLIEALSAYYNVAFILLRTTLELTLKGAFWECLSHRAFRDNSRVLEADKRGKKVRSWLMEKFEQSPDLEEKLELVSASIYDGVSSKVENPKFYPHIKTIVRQLDKWGLFNPIPEAVSFIYDNIYRGLSADVHVTPNRTDIGNRLISESSEIFDQELLRESLREYAELLHQIMDIAVVIELNVMGDLIEKYKEVRAQITERLPILEHLGLEYGLIRAKKLLGLTVP